ncbi:extracellular catalytic domain type 1 short-chain-length polyhydroxyalkanoate depolymerase [Thalassotalea mangrovi]|uniref:PHB depolymerase family esterase n=1 Tax=Thalassotalea mangrovi TaxID=2572245 RepID=A0A4U1B5C9_9GAMM|nr:PHB depolymerase family esterase [Thalassotalea mangrovi]TKB45308.1 PHB depolymerase family esterase [Thalassotalea mangrovi]
MRFNKRLICALGLLVTPWVYAQDKLTEVVDFGANPGNLQLFHYLPKALPEQAPLVVAVHGCMETAQNFARNTGWLELAEKYQFAVLLPQTSKSNEPKGGCYRTWEPAHQQQGSGEPASVQQMISYMLETHKLDRQQVFITGMSSGAHFAQVMLAAYPQTFAGGALQSSFPYKCANDISELGPCAFGKKTASAKEMAASIRQASGSFNGSYPKLQIWHGTEDPYIYHLNLEQLVQQWGTVMGLDLKQETKNKLLGYPSTNYYHDNNQLQLQAISLTSMGHAIAVDPGTAEQQCGREDTFAKDMDICAAYWIADFFGIAH